MATDKYVLDSAGNPVVEPDLYKWGAWMQRGDRHVAKDKTPKGAEVSTVFLGLDHSFTGGVPILYETMIFGGKEDQYQDRYATREEALEGHQKALKMALDAENTL